MNHWLNIDGLASRRYLQQLGLRSPISIQVYRSVLNSFCRFAEEHSTSKSLSIEVIREWRCDRQLALSPHLVLHRTTGGSLFGLDGEHDVLAEQPIRRPAQTIWPANNIADCTSPSNS
jgi:hypothetical protein